MSTNLQTPTNTAPSRPRREPAKPTNRPSGNRAPPPLTHHDIMGLMPPLTKAGEALDLEHSDRARRFLTFKPKAIPAGSLHPPLTATLRLELPAFGRPRRLIRTFTSEDGDAATMTVEGKDLETMVGYLNTVSPERQIICRDDVVFCRSYRVALEEKPPAVVTLARAHAVFDGLTLEITDEHRAVIYPITLIPGDGRKLKLPQDFFGVIGPSWRALRPDEGATRWRGGVRPPLREPERTAVLERRLDEAVAHCRNTFASDPKAFHPTYVRARWRMVGQRLLPLFTALSFAGGAVALALALPKTPLWHMVMSQVPIVLICMVSLFKEQPKLEIPPLPAPLLRSAWPAVEQAQSQGESGA